MLKMAVSGKDDVNQLLRPTFEFTVGPLTQADVGLKLR